MLLLELFESEGDPLHAATPDGGEEVVPDLVVDRLLGPRSVQGHRIVEGALLEASECLAQRLLVGRTKRFLQFLVNLSDAGGRGVIYLFIIY